VSDLKANAERMYGDDFAKKPAYIAKLAEEEDIDKNRLVNETKWALKEESAESYANLLKGPAATPAALERRKAFWENVRKVKKSGSNSSTVPAKSLDEDYGIRV
jgi:hypothetical protein